MKKYFPVLLLLCISCNSNKLFRTSGNHPAIGHYGRTIIDHQNDLVLIGAASYAEFSFTGESCVVYMKNITHPGDYNYVVIELDNEYKQRLKVDGDQPKPYTIRASGNSSPHLLRIFKATESHNGNVAITGVEATGLKAADHPLRKKIEFIGNSITAGMSSDTREFPCGTGKWYDQHNAYLAYGPRTARAVGADFMLSAVSGIGIYRNWNSDGPAMPQVYESAYLQIDSAKRWDFSQYTPDLVSICLGTNDFSDGDGKTQRLPFDSAVYIKNYVNFIGTIYKYYPSTQVLLLTSPMLNGTKSAMMLACLQTVQNLAGNRYPGKPAIRVFEFKPMVPKGCGYHPNIDDHALLANELIPYLEKLLQETR